LYILNFLQFPATIGPPANVRVQAITNSSVVVQWDFGGGRSATDPSSGPSSSSSTAQQQQQADGFVVKYMYAKKSLKNHWN
jgi:hypothetical protein